MRGDPTNSRHPQLGSASYVLAGRLAVRALQPTLNLLQKTRLARGVRTYMAQQAPEPSTSNQDPEERGSSLARARRQFVLGSPGLIVYLVAAPEVELS